jgi:CheY-like chemotaxis protein
MAKPGLQADESRKILIVDDNEDAAESLAALLQIEGHETRTACSGESALDIVPSFNPDVVVLDIGLPGADGYEVALRTPRILID